MYICDAVCGSCRIPQHAITLDSSHTEHTQRSWHVDSICLQERYSEYVIKF